MGEKDCKFDKKMNGSAIHEPELIKKKFEYLKASKKKVRDGGTIEGTQLMVDV